MIALPIRWAKKYYNVLSNSNVVILYKVLYALSSENFTEAWFFKRNISSEIKIAMPLRRITIIYFSSNHSALTFANILKNTIL